LRYGNMPAESFSWLAPPLGPDCTNISCGKGLTNSVPSVLPASAGVSASFSHLPDLDLTGPSTSTLLDCHSNGTLHQCAALCAQNEACRAFTWASNYQAASNCSNPCFMMYTVKRRTQRSRAWGVASGIRVPRAWAMPSWTPPDEAGDLAFCCDDATSWNSTLGHCDRDTFVLWANTKFRKGDDDPEDSNVDWCAPPGSVTGN